MAPSAENGDNAVLDSLKPPTGVVIPPKEIRSILEKTAGYVARNGNVFEDRIRDKESSNPKFCFLNPSDAYHAFYQWRLVEIRSGRGTDIAAGRAGEVATPVTEKPKGPPKPADFQFSSRMPRINQKDLDAIRLTALFVAKNGRQFMKQIAHKETNNPQFQFLIPNHTFHNFFQHYVDQYTTLLRASGLSGEGGKMQAARMIELDNKMESKFQALNQARHRAEYAKFQESEKVKDAEEVEKKAEEFARVDWSDFVVVGVITFDEADEGAELPPPTNLSELQYASLEDRNKMSIGASMRIEEAFPGEEDQIYNGHTAAAAPGTLQPTYPLPMHAGYAPQLPAYPGHTPSPVTAGGYAPAKSAQDEEEERRIQERMEAQARVQQAHAEARGGIGPMKIKENYVPRAAQKAANKQNAQTSLCPQCKQHIPTDELEHHMRVELLDPRWKEQKARAEARVANSVLSHVDVANNLKRLASQRADVFDPITGQSLTEEEVNRRKKAAIHSFDGNLENKSQAHINQLQTVNVEEQIRAIHQKFSSENK